MKEQIRLLGLRLALLMALYTFCRLLFWLLNQTYLSAANASKIALAMLHGLRFDAAALCMLNLPLILLSLLPFKISQQKKWQHYLRLSFLVINTPFLWLNVADSAYFSFTGRRSTVAILGIWQDASEQAGQIIRTFWPVALTAIVLSVLLFWHFPRVKKSMQPHAARWQNWLPLPIAILFSVFLIRGGLQLKPLRPSHAFMLAPVQLGHLTLNSTFSFLKSAGQPHLQPRRYFADKNALLAALPVRQAFTPLPALNPAKPNVVVIILESFAAEYTGIYNPGHGFTPFLDSLARHSLVFSNHYANGRRSIEALPALFAGIPSLMEEPYITSAYQANTLKGLGTELQQLGYNTHFFHGAANGTMGFSNFTRMAGVQHYYGLNEYPSPGKDYDGSWGIYDEPYLQYVSSSLTKAEAPFFASVFTLSSHPPYHLPPQHRNQYPKGTLPIHETIGYTDYALRKFFETARSQTWFTNTLFIITADHTQESKYPTFQNIPGHFKVPLLYYMPGAVLPPTNTAKVSQHTDLPETLMHLVGKPTHWPFSRSLFNQKEPGKALLYADNQFVYLQDSLALVLPDEGTSQLYKYHTDPGFQKPLPLPGLQQQLDKTTKAYIQLYYNGLIENSWYTPSLLTVK